MPTTGTTLLPDMGALSYNGVVWSCLYKSRANGVLQPDNAGRTVKCVEWTIEADGIVTLNNGETSTDARMEDIRQLLSAYGGTLSYQSKGLGTNLLVNQPGSPVRDVAWGPKTKVIDFQPLGGSRGARVVWTVTTLIPELSKPLVYQPGKGNLLTVLQFNQEESISYDDEGYSTRTIKGTLEIPLSRSTVNSRAVTDTVDAYRQQFISVVNLTDLLRFRVTHRTFDVSRDQRTCEWNFVIEELPPMGLPMGCTNARGTMSVRPETKTPALMPWIVSLRATYTVRKDAPRRVAWWAFLGLLKFRMEQSAAGNVPLGNNPPVGQQNPLGILNVPPNQLNGVDQSSFLPGNQNQGFGPNALSGLYANFFKALQTKFPARAAGDVLKLKCILLHFGIDEGVYLDSKTISFEASWRLLTTMSHILLASGVWKQSGVEGGNAWAMTIRDIQGPKSWLVNAIDPTADVIVDLGGP